MAWISASWQYILSSLSVVGEGKTLGVLVAAAPVWPPSLLAEGAAPLARAWVVVKSTIRILSASGAGSRHGGVSSRAMVVVSWAASLFHRCAVSCSTLGCQAWHALIAPP
jgi:hypothetical protein